MNELNSLYRKFSGTACLILVSRGLALILGVIYARYLGPEQYGLYTFVLSVISLAILPVVAGLPALLVREIASFQLESNWPYLIGIINWSRIYVITVSITMMFFLYLGVFLNLFDESISSMLWIAVLLIPFKGGCAQQSAIFNGFRMPILAQLPTQILAPTFTLFIFLVFIILGVNVTAEVAINISVLTAFCSFFTSAILIKLKLKLKNKAYESEYSLKKWHKSLLPFTLMALIGTLNTELATIVLGASSNNESVAYFKVAMQAISLIVLGLTSVNTVIMPNVARLYKQGDLKQTQLLLTKSVRLSTLVSFPIIITLIVFGEPLIKLLFGGDYLDAYPLLVILCFGQCFNVLMGSVGLVLNMTGNENSALKALLITLGINVASLLILVPLYGAIGAAIAVSLGLVCWNVLMAIDVWRYTKLKTWFVF